MHTFLTPQLVGHPWHGASALLVFSVSTTFLYRSDQFNLLSTFNLVSVICNNNKLKRSHEQNNSETRVFENFVNFLAVLWRTITFNTDFYVFLALKPRQQVSLVLTLNSTKQQRFTTRRRKEILTPSVQALQHPRETSPQDPKPGFWCNHIQPLLCDHIVVVITHSIYLPFIVTILTNWHS